MQTALATNGLGHGASAPINKALNILILDDSSFDRLRLRREITASHMMAEVDEISCLCQLHEALGTKRYDLVAIDYFLPDGTGEEALDIYLITRSTRRQNFCWSQATSGWMKIALEIEPQPFAS